MTVEEAKRKFYEDCIAECDCCEYYDTRDLSNSSGCTLVDELLEEVDK